MRCDIIDADLSHAPVCLIVATPLHTRVQRAGRIVKNTEPSRHGEGIGTDRSKQDRAGLPEKVRDMSGARVVTDDGAATSN
jgi:hypothetical protein